MLLNRLILSALLASATFTGLHAQARPTASRVADVQIGGGVISADSAYDGRFKGFFGYADVDLTRHFGTEIVVHQIYSSDGQQIHERTYELGLRYHRPIHHLDPFAKLLAGRGVFNFPYNQANLGYNLYAAGAGFDYKLRRHLNLRADFEYQRWLSFQSTSLTPTLISVGAAYHF